MVTIKHADLMETTKQLFTLYEIEECLTTKRELESEIIELNLKLAWHVANKFKNNNYRQSVDELFSIASFGLLKAIRSFKLDKKIKFATYAGRCMENEVLMEFRNKHKDVKYNFLSMDMEIKQADGSISSMTEIIEDKQPDFEETHADNELLIAVCEKAKLILNERDMTIFINSLKSKDEKMTQRDIADLLNISQSYISRLEDIVVGKIKQLLKEEWGDLLWKG